ncbi:hypothetical protein [Achromobacter spanius]|nr:hypothetical protein [Achromobacter spanius]
MTAQSFMPTSPLVGTPRQPVPVTASATSAPTASLPAAPATVAPSPEASSPVAVLEIAQAPDRGFLTRLWNAYLAHRNAARMRNIAQDMEPHMLNDVGAPQWLVNEATVRRELTRLRHVDFIRW